MTETERLILENQNVLLKVAVHYISKEMFSEMCSRTTGTETEAAQNRLRDLTDLTSQAIVQQSKTENYLNLK